MIALDLRHPPPASPREWVVHVRPPVGAALCDHAAHDAAAAAAAPPGWYCVGTIPISPSDRTRLADPSAWSLRVTYWPEAWRPVTTLAAAPAVYATAQIAGLPTRLDGTLSADHHGVQYRTPDGRPIARQCFWEGRDQLPAPVRSALDVIQDIDRRRTVGYMWTRPDTDRARRVAADEATHDNSRRAAACEDIARWIRSEHASILRQDGAG